MRLLLTIVILALAGCAKREPAGSGKVVHALVLKGTVGDNPFTPDRSSVSWDNS